MDDRNIPEDGTAELSMHDAVSMMSANSDEEQSPPATETEEPETEETDEIKRLRTPTRMLVTRKRTTPLLKPTKKRKLPNSSNWIWIPS